MSLLHQVSFHALTFLFLIFLHPSIIIPCFSRFPITFSNSHNSSSFTVFYISRISSFIHLCLSFFWLKSSVVVQQSTCLFPRLYHGIFTQKVFFWYSSVSISPFLLIVPLLFYQFLSFSSSLPLWKCEMFKLNYPRL